MSAMNYISQVGEKYYVIKNAGGQFRPPDTGQKIFRLNTFKLSRKLTGGNTTPMLIYTLMSG